MRVVRGRAEALPLKDGSVDAVVCTHVLCTVSDPEAALREVARVLRPGGLFLFLEHEAAQAMPPGRRPAGTRRGLARWVPPAVHQRLLEGPWRVIAGGCRLTRRTGDVVAAAAQPTKKRDAMFDLLELERFQLPDNAACFPGMWLIASHVKGAARTRGGAVQAAAAEERAAVEATASTAATGGAAVPAGHPAATERAKEAKEAAAEDKAERHEGGETLRAAADEGPSIADVARVAAEVAAVGAVAAATLTAASAPALMRRAYEARGAGGGH